MLKKVLEFLYPTKCAICNEINNEELCKKCAEKLNKKFCYKIIDYTDDETKNFDKHIYLFKYNGILREKMISYKFNDAAYLYKFFAKILYKNKKICRFLKSYDIIIPVPIHKKRINKRGYNQTQLIARDISKMLGIRMLDKILIKTKNNFQQAKLNKIKRKQNVIGAYIIKNSEYIRNKKIILLDDIYTTGSTVNECSKMLKQAKAKEIIVLTIAKD